MGPAELTAAVRCCGAYQALGPDGGFQITATGDATPAYAVSEERSPGLASRAAAAVLLAYKRVISPILPPARRFTPTCSEYARLAILKYGVFRGGIRAVGRVLRCHPWHPGGIDMP